MLPKTQGAAFIHTALGGSWWLSRGAASASTRSCGCGADGRWRCGRTSLVRGVSVRMTQGGSFSSAANAGGSASDESDADFRTVRKAPPSATSMDAVLERIKKDVAAHKVVLYMKGEPKAPLCGFSYKAVVILNSAGVPYKTFNVLADPALREGIKKFSQWPTIPQLFIDGEFVGGSDIMEKMHETGELTKLFADAGL